MKELIGVIIFTVAMGVAMFSLAPDTSDLPEYDCRHHNNCHYYGSNQ